MGSKLLESPIVHELLGKDNYKTWSTCIKTYLLGEDLWDFVVGETMQSTKEGNEEQSRIWRKQNAKALHIIQISCGLDVFTQIMEIESAKLAWDKLASLYMPRPQAQEDRTADQTEFPCGGDRSAAMAGSPYIMPLYNAANNGDLQAVENYLQSNPHLTLSSGVTQFDQTVLHIAVEKEQWKFVEEFVKKATTEDLEKQDLFGNTVLTVAAQVGNVKIAELIIIKNKNMLSIVNKAGFIPSVVASNFGRKSMVRYLYPLTPEQDLDPETGTVNGANLLASCINSKILDVALSLVEKFPKLATSKDKFGLTPMQYLVHNSSLFQSSSKLPFWQQRVYSCIPVRPLLPSADSGKDIENAHGNPIDGQNSLKQALGVLHQALLLLMLAVFFGPIARHAYRKKSKHFQARKLVSCICDAMVDMDTQQLTEIGFYQLPFVAAKNGIVEILVEMRRVDPTVTSQGDVNGRGIYAIASLERQKGIFSLLTGKDTKKSIVVINFDKDGNTLLHQAAKLPPSPQLDHICGAALQMQRELQWFKEVEKYVRLRDRDAKNLKGQTPRDLFTLEHKNLKDEGEKWMKHMASSCTVVGALIATMMFAASFTVPGGNSNSGYPIFLKEGAFLAFILADAISLFSSSTSVLMFLGVLTSRYTEEDFLSSLPTKLIIGLSALFFSIVTMMVTFGAAIYLVLHHRVAWIPIPVILLASIPVTLFAVLQFPLLVDIFISTFGPGIYSIKSRPLKFRFWCKQFPK